MYATGHPRARPRRAARRTRAGCTRRSTASTRIDRDRGAEHAAAARVGPRATTCAACSSPTAPRSRTTATCRRRCTTLCKATRNRKGLREHELLDVLDVQPDRARHQQDHAERVHLEPDRADPAHLRRHETCCSRASRRTCASRARCATPSDRASAASWWRTRRDRRAGVPRRRDPDAAAPVRRASGHRRHARASRRRASRRGPARPRRALSGSGSTSVARSPTSCSSTTSRARSSVHKIASTPSDPSQATMVGLRELCELGGVGPPDVEQLLHGTTVATNIVLERNGSTTGMITTRGFRDIIYIGRHRRPKTFSIYQDLPWREPTLVARRNRHVVSERVVPPGDVEIAARRGRGARRGRRAARGGGRGGRGLLPVLVPQPRARAASQGDPRGGAARGPPVDQPRGRPAAPRVRAVLDHGARRLHRPEDQPLPAQHAHGAARRRRRTPTSTSWRPTAAR